MLELIPAKPKSLDRYIESVGEEPIETIRSLAAKLDDARILHVNATSFGGGVAELLATAVPLMRGLGLDCDWQVMFGSDDFFNVTKTMHNALQGMEVAWTPQMEKTYLDKVIDNVARLDTDYDFVVIHDPQPAAMLHILEYETQQLPRGKWIWRCHIDTSDPFLQVADFLFPMIEPYDAAVFTMSDFVPSGYGLPPVTLIPPCIDPIALKNVRLNPATVRAIWESYDVDYDRPTLCQISRFDPWKDPLGVIDAYRIAKEEVPDLQLVLAGSMATDDPEGMHYLHRTEQHAAGDPDVYIFTNAHGVGSIEVNAFQTGADVVIQKSIREGFGLTVSEALWKRTPVVAGNVGGIRMQIEDGEGGFLVDSIEQCGEACIALLKDPTQRMARGNHAHEFVRTRYVTTVLLEKWLNLFVELSTPD
ncbi:MAG: glycosyltransferase [Acidimicrobiia bacterium]|nr:glycosyltransferase [Acidimicrobiia bacterium]